MNIKMLIKKLKLPIQRIQGMICKQREAGGKISARYCYSVWLRYLILINKNGLRFPVESVAELGPGASLGIGLAAILSGVNKYYAFDIVRHANTEKNLEVFHELVELYKKQEDIPGPVEFTLIKPYLESYKFPIHILTKEYLDKTLKENRVESIKRALVGFDSKGDNTDIQICYFAPWNDPNVIKEKSVDMIYSQAVMEHVDDLDFTYKTLYRWLKPNGHMFHQIDFKSHDTAKEWNGHWKYSDSEWKNIRKDKPYLVNREPYSTHVYSMEKNGFRIIFEKKIKNASELKNAIGVQRKDLAPRFKDMSNDDLTTSGVFVLAVKL